MISDKQLENIREKLGEVRVSGTSIEELVGELQQRRTGWVLLANITSSSGKSLYACVRCGWCDPAPTENHQCQSAGK